MDTKNKIENITITFDNGTTMGWKFNGESDFNWDTFINAYYPVGVRKLISEGSLEKAEE